MVDYSSEANNRKKSILCVIASKGLMDPILPISPSSSFFINAMPSQMNHVRFGTITPYICCNVPENVLHFGQNH